MLRYCSPCDGITRDTELNRFRSVPRILKTSHLLRWSERGAHKSRLALHTHAGRPLTNPLYRVRSGFMSWGLPDPPLYLTRRLINLPQAKMSKLSDWLPDQWKARHVARVASLKTDPYSQYGTCSPTVRPEIYFAW